jgi:hypothetical protein
VWFSDVLELICSLRICAIESTTLSKDKPIV